MTNKKIRSRIRKEKKKITQSHSESDKDTVVSYSQPSVFEQEQRQILWKSHNYLSQSQPDYLKVKKKQVDRRGKIGVRNDYYEESIHCWKHQRHKNKSNKQKKIFESAFL